MPCAMRVPPAQPRTGRIHWGRCHRAVRRWPIQFGLEVFLGLEQVAVGRGSGQHSSSSSGTCTCPLEPTRALALAASGRRYTPGGARSPYPETPDGLARVSSSLQRPRSPLQRQVTCKKRVGQAIRADEFKHFRAHAICREAARPLTGIVAREVNLTPRNSASRL